ELLMKQLNGKMGIHTHSFVLKLVQTLIHSTQVSNEKTAQVVESIASRRNTTWTKELRNSMYDYKQNRQLTHGCFLLFNKTYFLKKGREIRKSSKQNGKMHTG